MENQGKDRVEVWVGFLQSTIWPITVLVVVTLLRSDISGLLGRVNKVTVPGGTSIELAAQAAVERIDKHIEQVTAPTAASPKDVAPSPEVKALVDAKQTLLASIGAPSLTRTGWAYCGAVAGGRWTSPPNLAITNAQEPQKGQSYKVTTDTYLRENPPRESTPKGGIISVILEGTSVKVLEVMHNPDPDPREPGRAHVWVQVEYQPRSPLAS